MKKSATVLVLGGVFLLACAGLWAGGAAESGSAGSSAAAQATTIRAEFFFSESMYPTWKSSIKDFEAKHPNIKVDLQMVGSTGASPKMQTEMLSANPPDVILFWKYLFNDFGSSGQLVDLTPMLDAAGMSKKGYLIDGETAWCSPKFDSHVYGLSTLIGPTVYFYNVDLFKSMGLKPPKTYQDLLALGPEFKSRGIMPMVGDWNGINLLDVLAKIQVQTTGLQPLRDIVDGKATFLGTSSLVQAVKMFKEMSDAGLISTEAATMNESTAISAFVAGKAAMYSNKANTIIAINHVKPAEFNYDFFSVNYVDKPVTPYSATYGAVWAIPSKSKNQEAAWTFLKWMWSVDWQKANIAQQDTLSSVAAANDAISDPVLLKIAKNVIPTLTVDSFYIVDMLPNPVLKELGTRLQQLVSGEIDVTQTLQYTQDSLDALKK